MMITSFCLFLLLFLGIGVLSSLVKKNEVSDYLVAGNQVSPWLVALSGVATNNSGYMFIGLIGFTYEVGLHSMWLMFGWIFGDFLSAVLLGRKFRAVAGREDNHTYPRVLSNWFGDNQRSLRRLIGCVALLFLGAYAAAQLTAGSKALHVLFGWNIHTGAILGAVIVLVYCYAGGIRASIWTDAAQSIVMIVAMTILAVVGISAIGGTTALWAQLAEVDASLVALFPESPTFGAFLGPLLFVASWITAGLGVVGQPHIMIRFMAIDNEANLNRARVYYYSWYTVFSALAICVGLVARLLLPESGAFDPELALPKLAIELLPDIFVGLILAGLFAATMSTADSLVLSCSAVLTEDLRSRGKSNLIITKGATVFVTLLALGIALFASKSVFVLVVLVWATLSVAFSPLVFIFCLNRHLSEKAACFLVLFGIGVVILWRQLGLSGEVYETLPGIFLSFLLAFFLSRPRRDELVSVHRIQK